MKSFIIEKPNPYLLVFRKSRLRYLISAVFDSPVLAFLGFVIYVVFYSSGSNPNLIEVLVIILIFFLMLDTLFDIVDEIRIAFWGEVFIFDSAQRIVLKDNERILSFDDVSMLQLKIILDSEGPDDYRLSPIKKDGTKVKIGRNTNYDEVVDASSDIAGILNVEIVREEQQTNS